MLAGGALGMLACDAAPAKTKAKANRVWSLLALAGLRPNWPLALDE